MKIVGKENYVAYLLANEVNEKLKKRDLVTEVEKYIDSALSKVVLVSGFRGSGKSIGVNSKVDLL